MHLKALEKLYSTLRVGAVEAVVIENDFNGHLKILITWVKMRKMGSPPPAWPVKHIFRFTNKNQH